MQMANMTSYGWHPPYATDKEDHRYHLIRGVAMQMETATTWRHVYAADGSNQHGDPNPPRRQDRRCWGTWISSRQEAENVWNHPSIPSPVFAFQGRGSTGGLTSPLRRRDKSTSTKVRRRHHHQREMMASKQKQRWGEATTKTRK